jgi:hypothetical protein
MYLYFDSTGPATVPFRSDVVRLATGRGTLTALVLDANVCLDLAGVTRGTLKQGPRALADRFLGDIAASGADVLPGFGLTELSLNRATWTVDSSKLASIQNSIGTAIDSIPGRAAQRGEHVTNAEDTGPADPQIFRPLVPLIKVFYASLLKIALMSLDGIGQSDALGKLQALLRWMSDDLDCVSALSLQAGVAIFGGDTLARQLIGVGKLRPTLRNVWSGAWDMFYAHHILQLTLHGVDGLPCYPIFVTRDRACFAVFSRPALRGAIRFDTTRMPMLVGITSDYPHYRKQQVEVADLVKTALLSRLDTLVGGGLRTESHLDGVIASLESEWCKHLGGGTDKT